MDNMYRYQGAYSEWEEETGWNDFELRTYDGQIGRWTGVDPYDEFASPYIGMANDPINNIDPDGGCATCNVLPEVIVRTVRHTAPSFAQVATRLIYTLGPVLNNYINSSGETFRTTQNLGSSITYINQQYTWNGTEQDTYTETVPVEQPSYGGLDGQNNLYADVERRMNVGQARLIRKFWRSAGGNKMVNALTGAVYYSPTASEPMYPERLVAIPGGLITKGVGRVFGGAAKGLGTELNVLSRSEILRIENAATRIKKPITVVGSRAKGTAGANSDWDYVIPGLNSKNWSTIKNSLPGSRSILDNTPRNIDIFKGPVRINEPHITIYPR